MSYGRHLGNSKSPSVRQERPLLTFNMAGGSKYVEWEFQFRAPFLVIPMACEVSVHALRVSMV